MIQRPVMVRYFVSTQFVQKHAMQKDAIVCVETPSRLTYSVMFTDIEKGTGGLQLFPRIEAPSTLRRRILKSRKRNPLKTLFKLKEFENVVFAF